MQEQGPVRQAQPAEAASGAERPPAAESASAAKGRSAPDASGSLSAVRPRGGLLREEVYAQLRDAIIAGRYAPGQRLRDADLAAELEVSRTPVREALRRLEDEGFVETWANRWTRVTAIDIDEAERIYPIVGALERLALLEAGAIPPDLIGRLEEANARLQEGLEREDPILSSRADVEFHDALLRAWDNPELRRVMAELKLRLRRIEVHYFGGSLPVARSIEEHAAVIEALAAGDLAAAAEAVAENWRRSLERLRERSP
jgi:DNA-binding GntR family transcriptional regulator